MSWENILKQIDEVEAIFGKVYWIDGGPSVETKDINKINQVEQNLQKFRTEVISRLINFNFFVYICFLFLKLNSNGIL